MLNWKPKNKKAAICFTIDDIHPGKSSDLYEAGGDLDKGALKHVIRLLNRHPKLKLPFLQQQIGEKLTLFRPENYWLKFQIFEISFIWLKFIQKEQ